MSSPAYNVATFLAGAGLGTLGTNIFVGEDPGGSNLTITVYDTSGATPDVKFARDFPGIQIVVKGPANDYAVGYQKALAIKNYLLGLPNQAVGTAIYFGFNMKSDITHVGSTAEDRPIFTTNWRFYIDHENVGNRVSL